MTMVKYKNNKIEINKRTLVKNKFLKQILDASDFASLCSDVVFENEVTNTYTFNCNTLTISLKKKMVVNTLINKKISDCLLLIKFNNGMPTLIPANKILCLSYSDFINFLTNIAPNDFVNKCFLEKSKQLSLEDFLLC